MNKWITIFAALVITSPAFSQVEEETEEVETEEVIFEEKGEGEPDTTRMNVGNHEVIIITKGESEDEFDLDFDEENGEVEPRKKRGEAHWSGLDLGFTMLMNDQFESTFENHPFWQNDPARSQVWNLNLMERRFDLGTPYVGLTTGLGFSFTSVAFRDNYVLTANADTVFASIDTVNFYSKNKLKASYLTVPLLLEFNTSTDANKSFYLATGVVGGVRLTSKIKRKGEFDGKEFEHKNKGTYGLNSFKLDATARLGYGDWGAFANYSLLPLFDTGKTVEVYPITFGLSYNF